jgi:2-polyprenyl-3-methyl-5-hydroxy-6-metoxy-1,4-benzoquinol methylase
MSEQIKEFYAEFASLYHLIYPDWGKSIQRQASMLDAVITEAWGKGISSVLDVSCGIGTQSLGLAELGYEVTASDLSPHEIERAKREAEARGLSIEFSAADMRKAHNYHARQYHLVILCDDAIPHLLAGHSSRSAGRVDIVVAHSQT